MLRVDTAETRGAIPLSPEDAEAVQVWGKLSAEEREVVRALPTLPDPVRAALLAMVKAASVQGQAGAKT